MVLASPPSESLPVTAINTATAERLASVLHSIISTSSEAGNVALYLLTTTADKVSDPNSKELPNGGDGEECKESAPLVEPPPSKKRKHDDAIETPRNEMPLRKRVKKYELCSQCGKEFDVTLNWAEACLHHAGKPQLYSVLEPSELKPLRTRRTRARLRGRRSLDC